MQLRACRPLMGNVTSFLREWLRVQSQTGICIGILQNSERIFVGRPPLQILIAEVFPFHARNTLIFILRISQLCSNGPLMHIVFLFYYISSSMMLYCEKSITERKMRHLNPLPFSNKRKKNQPCLIDPQQVIKQLLVRERFRVKSQTRFVLKNYKTLELFILRRISLSQLYRINDEKN